MQQAGHVMQRAGHVMRQAGQVLGHMTERSSPQWPVECYINDNTHNPYKKKICIIDGPSFLYSVSLSHVQFVCKMLTIHHHSLVYNAMLSLHT